MTYSENLIKYDILIQKLWQVCLNYHSVTPPGIINKASKLVLLILVTVHSKQTNTSL